MLFVDIFDRIIRFLSGTILFQSGFGDIEHPAEKRKSRKYRAKRYKRRLERGRGYILRRGKHRQRIKDEDDYFDYQRKRVRFIRYRLLSVSQKQAYEIHRKTY